MSRRFTVSVSRAELSRWDRSAAAAKLTRSAWVKAQLQRGTPLVQALPRSETRICLSLDATGIPATPTISAYIRLACSQ